MRLCACVFVAACSCIAALANATVVGLLNQSFVGALYLVLHAGGFAFVFWRAAKELHECRVRPCHRIGNQAVEK